MKSCIVRKLSLPLIFIIILCGCAPITYKVHTNVDLNQISSIMDLRFPNNATVRDVKLVQQKIAFTGAVRFEYLWARIDIDNADLDVFKAAVEERARGKLETPFVMDTFGGAEHFPEYPEWWNPLETAETVGLRYDKGGGIFEVQISAVDNNKSTVYIQWLGE